MEISYHISWRRDRVSAGGNCDATTVANGNRLLGEGSLRCQHGCSGTITAMRYICTDFSIEENWSFGERRLSYDFSTVTDIATTTQVTIGFSGAAWIAPLSSGWNLSTTFSLTRRNDTSHINSTPRAITSPVIRLQEGCNHTIALAVNDPDGDIIRCRWAVGMECSGICNQFPGAELDPHTCTISYEANRGTRYWAAALMIEDFTPESSQPLSSVALQFLVLVFPSNDPCFQKPVFITPTIQHGTCVAIPPGITFVTQLTASSGGSDIVIAEIQTTSPLGTSKGEVQHINGSTTYYVNITWTPEEDQQNQTHLFCYTAVDSDGIASAQTCIQLLPGYFPPKPIQETATHNQQLVHPSNTTWHVRFDSSIQRSSVVSFITFHDFNTEEEVYRIDASQSQEVVFELSNKISISPNHVFEEKKVFYINLDRSVVQGLQGCGPGNEPVENKNFWTFKTTDVTAPMITFLENPPVTNANITLSWESNEEVTWQCRLVKDAIKSAVNCSEAEWRGYGLRGGFYNLEVSATDESGNMATVLHTFEVDLISPTISLVQKPTPLSNQQITTFTFVCNEVCSFECEFISNNISHENSPCNQGRFITPALENNGIYTFKVTATDQVGNRGQAAVYAWETDYEKPQIFGVHNLSVPCADTGPQHTGQAEATDNRPEVISVMYDDVKIGCSIRRTWTATDEAGNSAHLIQRIDLDFSPTVSLSPQVAFSCESASSSITVPTGTARALNPCGLPLQLTHEDSHHVCPGEVVRNWTVRGCDKRASALQTIILYDLCPPHACGSNESTPHGVCTFGECRCNRPWHGAECSVQIHEPSVQPPNDVVLQEGQEYNDIVVLLQGTPPLSWTLLSRPDQLTLDEVTGRVTWSRAQAGNHTIAVQIANEVGIVNFEWTLRVKPGYNAFLDRVLPSSFPRAQPVTLTGHVEYTTNNFTEEFPTGIVPVEIDIISNEITRKVSTLTNQDGLFSVVFYPVVTEYGTYTAGARHPSLLDATPQTDWDFLGMKAEPHVVTLNSQAVGEFEETFYNATVICNDGPATLSGLTVTPVMDSIDLNVQIFLHGLHSNVTLEPGDKLSVDMKVIGSQPLHRIFSIALATAQGTTLNLFVNLQVEQILPSFIVSPTSVNTRLVRGRSRVFEFNVTNVGSAGASNVKPAIPDADIFSFISFGSTKQNEGTQELNLRNGESATLSILIQIPETQQLGEISASVVIVSTEVSKAIPISLTVSSDDLLNLTVVVEDEYTYFASGQPLVDNADVTLINYQRGIRITEGTKGNNGSVTFDNIPEDRYEMIIGAPDHRTLRQIIITSVNEPVTTVFIERQAVSYTWSVTPVTFEDTYILTIEADFQTHVPIPVVTVTPTEVDLEGLENRFFSSIQLNITNHGLIRANDVSIQLPNQHPFLEFTTNTQELGNLEPLSFVIATVQVTRKSMKERTKRNGVTCTAYITNIDYTYVCGTLQLRSVSVVLKKGTGASCDLNFPTGSGSGRGILSFRGYSSRTHSFCDPCLQSVLSCALGLLPLPPVVGCIPMIISGARLSSVMDAVGWIGCTVGFRWLGRVGSRGVSREVQRQRGERIHDAIGIFGCFYGLYENCLNRTSVGSRRKRSVANSVNELAEAMYPIHQSIALGIEVLGDEAWLSVGDSTWLTQVLQPILDDRSESGVLISHTELSAISVAPLPRGTSMEMVTRMIHRLNNTLSGWNNGQLEPNQSSNMASISTIQALAEGIQLCNEKAKSKGFSSYIDAYNFARNEFAKIDQFEEEAGICAVVRIRIEQELALTREAFLAKLEIENLENSPLKQMELEIVIIDSSSGELATHLFSIGNETLSGSLRRVGSMWSLPSETTGVAEWLIVPYSEAAPDSHHVYDVGGTLRYSLNNENITVPLLPTLITVRPDPSLHVHYFWEKNVIGDDPFTDEVEPSVPFTLGVAVTNSGYGTAYSLKITSGQPEIIENEKGLLVNFMIIGANVGAESISPSLTVILGDLSPNTTVVARWLMISSLQGEFKNYSASFENINPLGDPKLSVLDELEVHELIRSVRMYNDDEGDGVLDFLVNERNDFLEYPDAIYSSKTLQRFNVSAGDVLSVQATSDTVSTLEVRTSSNHTGWVYYRYEDTQRILRRTAFTVNTTMLEANVTTPIPSENSWITRDRDSGRNMETFYLHIVAYVQTTDEVLFTMTLCTSDCSHVEIPYVPPTAGPAPTMAPALTSTQSSGSDVVTPSSGTESMNPSNKPNGKAVTPSGTTTFVVVFVLALLSMFL